MKSTFSSIIGGTYRSAPAVLITPRSVDDHRRRMTAMGTIRIPLHSRKYPDLFATIDESDLPLVKGLRWGVLVRKGVPRYAVHRHKHKAILMHRVILGHEDHDPEVDHEDGNGFNNSRTNLRAASKSQNMMNRHAFANNKSKIKGVSWKRFASGRGKWRAQIQVNGQKVHLGYFDTIEDAAAAYASAAVAYFGEFALIDNVLIEEARVA